MNIYKDLKKNIFSESKITNRIVIICVTTTFFVLGVKFVYQTIYWDNFVTKHELEKYDEYSKFITKQIANAVRWKKQRAIERIYDSVLDAKKNYVNKIYVYDESHKLLSKYPDSKDMKPLPKEKIHAYCESAHKKGIFHIIEKELYTTVSNVMIGDNTVGHLIIEWDNIKISADSNELIFKKVFLIDLPLMLGSTLLLILLLIRFCRRDLLQPIKELTNIARNIAHGMYVKSIPKTEREDEIGEMARAVEIFKKNVQERDKYMRETLKAKVQAEKASKSKGEFLATMSHEIRTPLNGIIGMGNLLSKTKLGIQQKSHLQAMLTSAEFLLEIINDILDFSKIEAGKLDIEEVEFDLYNLVDSCSEVLQVRAEDKRIQLLVSIQGNIPQFLIGDPNRIRQIIFNMVGNAIKFTSQGYVHLKLTMEEIDKNALELAFSIIDTGIGIKEENLNGIFDKFTQADSSTTRKFGGTGLGLAITKQLAELMGGGVSVKSVFGKGSEFNIKLKLKHEASNTVLEDPLVKKCNNMKCLIMSPLQESGGIIQSFLELIGDNSVKLVQDRKTAIKAINQAHQNNNSYDIIIIEDTFCEDKNENILKEIKKAVNDDKPHYILYTSCHSLDKSKLEKMGYSGLAYKPLQMLFFARIITKLWRAIQSDEEIGLITNHSVTLSKKNDQSVSDENLFTNANALVVEDNFINMQISRQILENFGCNVTPAGNGIEALQVFQERVFDLIFMDCQMPEMDGFEATKAIRQLEKERNLDETPIIAFTANAMKGDREKCLEAGMNDYISKPVDEKDIKKILRKWISNRESDTEQNTPSDERKVS